MRIHPNQGEALMVGLMQDDVQHTRSVKVLVAKAFVDGETDTFDTPIQKDNNHWNCRAENLAWRPRWFALEYVAQFREIGKDEIVWEIGPLIDSDGIIYKTTLDAVIVNGVLVYDVRQSYLSGARIFPIWKSFGLYKF